MSAISVPSTALPCIGVRYTVVWPAWLVALPAAASGNENFHPAEVERVLAEHSAIADVAVIGVPDDRRGKVPRAVVVLRAGASLDTADLVV
jgi:hypothetical protein